MMDDFHQVVFGNPVRPGNIGDSDEPLLGHGKIDEDPDGIVGIGR
jgi:hypothetical protein